LSRLRESLAALLNKHLLKLVYPAQSLDPVRVAVGFALEGETLRVKFDTQGTKPNANAKLEHGVSQWGLWDWDVVELFISADPASKTYYEFQLSPIGQFFELEIFEPRKSFNREFNSGFKHHVELVSPTHWRAEMQIPLKSIGWDGKPASLCANAFAILGEGVKKTYWSLTLPRQEKPDFHLPEHFQAVLSLL
jgi:hypothetical protein